MSSVAVTSPTTTTTPALVPPLDGSLDVRGLIDFHLTNVNLSSAYSFANDNASLTDISRFEFARAAHRAAHLLFREGARAGDVVAIVAHADALLYQAIVAGCIVAGLVPFPISQRNSEVALVHLLTTTNTRRILTTHKSLGPLLESISSQAAAAGINVQEIPVLGELYPLLGREAPQDAFSAYPALSSRAKGTDVALYLHSSGSTGLPKPIPLPHRTVHSFAGMDLFRQFGELAPRLAVGALPPFHAMGVFLQLIAPIFSGGTACIYPPVSMDEYRPPITATPENALDNARRAKANGIITVPAFLLEWAQREEDVRNLAALNMVMYSGGTLATKVGDYLVSQGVNLVQVYGGTEFAAGNTLKRTNVLPSEWNWLQISESVNIRWMAVGDGSFECQFLTTPIHFPAIENLPDVPGYATKDLFERHPTKPHLYRIVGRLDDVLIMANGEKTVPGPMEDILTASPFIAGAVMFGRERNQIGVLVEPSRPVNTQDPAALGEFRNLIWPVVEEANGIAPAFARVYKEMILVTSTEQPMIRAPKGTVVKKATIALYDAQITALYDTVEASTTADVRPPTSWAPIDIEPWLLTHTSFLSGKTMDIGGDLFEQGFDSLNATFLRHRIVAALRNYGEETAAAARNIPQNFVYAHPSIPQLARAISALVYGTDSSSSVDATEMVEAMITKYTQEFPPRAPHQQASEHVALLTGSTGGLGSHLLDILLRHPAVRTVYAFNRPGRTLVAERQATAFRERGLDVVLLQGKKLVFLEGDTTRADLGLQPEMLAVLRSTLTVIIHNAWALDFNKSLASFEPHVCGTRNLVDLALATDAKFMFTSSIASAQGWDRTKGAFPEELQLDAGVAVGNGYGESKYISERILAKSGLRATSFRIGQVTGSGSTGAWATTDWVPAIVKSSVALGCVPVTGESAASVAWLPPEAVAQAIVDVALLKTEQPFAVNLVHPRPVAWDFVFGAISQRLKLLILPMAQWLARVEERSRDASEGDMELVPAVKLLEFLKTAFTGAADVQFATARAESVSPAMKELKPLEVADVHRWLGYWESKDFL
ncbi:Acetyl-CoA synthetase-like protein [Mycena indigotica]|uniref:Acetyl-CoA synthetase-like protein n=1 Tax=Mycena indigotica TaxID=2126181 RepID=A0A8H6SQP2_9AGAR|nr:Acetyl-CoA synthetase-like protein [Mycena indigotica]KAF7303443.1 Acetyl-CoA synthetase-like protein [Mycena indigotica]